MPKQKTLFRKSIKKKTKKTSTLLWNQFDYIIIISNDYINNLMIILIAFYYYIII